MRPASEVARQFCSASLARYRGYPFSTRADDLEVETDLASLLERERREAGVEALEWALEHADDVGVYLDDNDHPTTGAAEIRNEIARLRAWKGNKDAQH